MIPPLNKAVVHAQIMAMLEQIHCNAQSATQTAIDAATSEETVAEHKYDTFSLEASYLAHGQAMRVQQCAQDIVSYQGMVLRDFDQDSPIALGALVTLEDQASQLHHYFIGPAAGGIELAGPPKVTVITPQSPLAQAMLGLKLDDEVRWQRGEQWLLMDVVAIC
ncbi:GreA/GreB family elongation factor [Vibrio stylophorae]|uniref:GreA/GreB family elongation factor n=1 Tax=Vibrio stylophorae TaxID=659351 RepID=UPI001F239D4B|nr:GreA/GreB family elongation factor [Vibrio stylophorae]